MKKLTFINEVINWASHPPPAAAAADFYLLTLLNSSVFKKTQKKEDDKNRHRIERKKEKNKMKSDIYILKIRRNQNVQKLILIISTHTSRSRSD